MPHTARQSRTPNPTGFFSEPKECYIDDWRQLVDSIMIDWNYDGVMMQPSLVDIPEKKQMVKGIYDIPEDAGTIKIKLTDLLSESLEVEV